MTGASLPPRRRRVGVLLDGSMTVGRATTANDAGVRKGLPKPLRTLPRRHARSAGPASALARRIGPSHRPAASTTRPAAVAAGDSWHIIGFLSWIASASTVHPRMHDPSPVTGPAQEPLGRPLLQAIDISKRYGTFLANDAVSVDLMPREIHALLGENGAGKSTLVKVMYGLVQPTAGELRWQGEKVELAGPAAARALGVAMVFQHFSLFENLTVAENVALGLSGGEPFAAMTQRLADLSRVYGLPLEPTREVWRLSVGERQRIEIVRALMQDPKLLILDEPTSVLTPQETDQLFITLKRLKSEGRAVLYISHKLDEVKALCDTATILRGGRKVATCDPRLETPASLARMMVGADVGEVRAAIGRKTGVPRLVIRDLTLAPDDPHGVRLDAISLDVRAGEIVGIAGVSGNGQGELFAALSGERASLRADNIVIDGRAVGQLSITDRRRLGAAFVPEERLGHAAAPRMKLSENALLTGHASGGMVRRGFIDRTATLAAVDTTTRAFDVRKAKRDPEAVSLSGGNLQKFVVGREILREPGVLVVAQPTWGVDAGAAATVRQALIDLAARGAAVLIISQDLDEIEEIADRIAVIFHGRLSETVDSAATTRESLGLLMGGSTGKGKAGGTAYAGAPRSPTGMSHAASTRLVDIPPTSLPSPDLIRGLTRQSILVRRRWTRGSSPRVTGEGCINSTGTCCNRKCSNYRRSTTILRRLSCGMKHTSGMFGGSQIRRRYRNFTSPASPCSTNFSM